MADLGNTQYFEVQTDAPTGVKEVLACVYEALQEIQPRNNICIYRVPSFTRNKNETQTSKINAGSSEKYTQGYIP